MEDIAININHLVKEYDVYSRPVDVALEVLTRKSRHVKFRALDEVSFSVKRGEVVGIIGTNGAGKSTLLKIITGVLDATAGYVSVVGRVTAILELGLGFNPEYTGRQNIYLSGMLYGMTKSELDKKIDSIIEFSGLGEFIDRPAKTYSSGMHSRLAFSIATAVDPDILIIDEALAAGDAAFVQKCLRRIRELCSGGRTVLLVSHGTGLLAQLCHRVVWLEQGRVKMIGTALNVVQAYDLAAHQGANSDSWIEAVDDELHTPVPSAGDVVDGASEGAGEGQVRKELRTVQDARALFAGDADTGKLVFRRGPVFIDSVDMYDADGQPSNRLTLLRPFVIKVRYRVEGEMPTSTLGVALAINNKADLSPVAQFMTQNIRPGETMDSYHSSPDRVYPSRTGTLSIEVDAAPFRKGDYLLSIGLLPNEPASWEFYEYRHFYYSFSVDDCGVELGAPVWLAGRLNFDGRAQHAVPSSVAEVESVPQRLPVVRTWDGVSKPVTLRQEIEQICFSDSGYPLSWPRHLACPACSGPSFRTCFTKFDFNHDRCDACGFVFMNPFPPEHVLTRLYTAEYYSKTRELFEKRRAEEPGSNPFSVPRDLLDQIIEKASAGLERGAWLDVGGGIGVFANHVRTSLSGWKVHLNETNVQSINIARQLFDLQVVDKVGDEKSFDGGLYDVISSIAVLEHVPDPWAFLSAYANRLNKGGYLVTVIPQFTNLNAFVSRGSSANVTPPHHLSLFNEKAFRRMVARIPELELADIFEYGPPAFQLIHHVGYGDHWDISIPSIDRPSPESIQIKKYTEAESRALGVLAKADAEIGEFFGDTDGRQYLVAYCRRT